MQENSVTSVAGCTLCGGRQFQQLFDVYDRLHRQPGSFALVQCLACGLVHLTPMPGEGELDRYYPSSEYYTMRDTGDDASSDQAVSGDWLQSLRQAVRRQILTAKGYDGGTASSPSVGVRVLEPLVGVRARYGYRQLPDRKEGGRALDVGCGSGQFMRILAELGWKTEGIERSPEAAAHAEARSGCKVWVGELSELNLPNSGYDFVNLSHVIEHVHDPVGVLGEIRELLAREGQVYVETPNAGSVFSSLMRERWFPWDAPRHLHVFDANTLRLACERAGLKVVRMESMWQPKLVRWEGTYAREEGRGEKESRRPLPLWNVPPAMIARYLAGRTLGVGRPRKRDVLGIWAERAQ